MWNFPPVTSPKKSHQIASSTGVLHTSRVAILLGGQIPRTKPGLFSLCRVPHACVGQLRWVRLHLPIPSVASMPLRAGMEICASWIVLPILYGRSHASAKFRKSCTIILMRNLRLPCSGARDFAEALALLGISLLVKPLTVIVAAAAWGERRWSSRHVLLLRVCHRSCMLLRPVATSQILL